APRPPAEPTALVPSAAKATAPATSSAPYGSRLGPLRSSPAERVDPRAHPVAESHPLVPGRRQIPDMVWPLRPEDLARMHSLNDPSFAPGSPGPRYTPADTASVSHEALAGVRSAAAEIVPGRSLAELEASLAKMDAALPRLSPGQV